MTTTLRAMIAAWDLQDIKVLRDLIAQDTDGIVNITNLPSAMVVPERIATYPVWAIDSQGMALVGPCADHIESLTEVYDSYPIARMSMQTYTTVGTESFYKTVGPGNDHSSRINMPTACIGKRVRVILLDN